ncbi:MAG: NAD(P)/FAD-dependent oxidoreductase [archaeon]
MSYDIVVVGAGPAGSTAARVAAEKGLKVALVERRHRIGFPKQCAEGMNDFAFQHLKIKPKKEWISNRIDSLYAGCPGKGSVLLKTISLQGYVMERKIFDPGLADMAVDAGAELFKSTSVERLEKNNTIVKAQNKTFKTKVVIGADGPNSTISKQAGLGMPKCGVGLQYEIKAKSDYPNALQIFFGKYLVKDGYAWIFPKKNTLNVGLGSYYSHSLIKELNNFVKATGVKGKIIETNGGLIPVHGPLERIYSKNLMMIGDAAGHTNPTTGGGIPAGMFDGKMAAEIAVKELESGRMDFSRYEKEWKKSIYGKTMKRSLIAQKYLLKATKAGYVDDFFQKAGDIKLKSIREGYKLLAKIQNPFAMYYFIMLGTRFLKIHKYAW